MWKPLSFLMAVIFGGIAFIITPWHFVWAALIGIGTIIVSYGVMQFLWLRFVDNDTLYIRNALREARKKNEQIQEYGYKLKMWRLWLKIRHIRKVNHEIIMTIEKHPGRFPQADQFFSLYLDSAVNVLGKYHTLVHQPVRAHGLQESLKQTEVMLDEVVYGLEQQLASVLNDDLVAIAVEKEVLDKYSRKERG